MQRLALLSAAVAVCFVSPTSAVPLSKAKVTVDSETVPTEFLQKFAKAAGGVLQPEPTPYNQVKFTPPPKTAPRSNNPTNANKELSYKVIQTIKGSYSALGPLQCESTCTVKEPKPTCDWHIPPCAVHCAEKCSQGTNEVALHRQLCVDGCTLFCGAKAPSRAGEDISGPNADREKFARANEQKGADGMKIAADKVANPTFGVMKKPLK